jgi:uncharacterized protein YdhG (YjbR/CyaY superfamily)
MSDQVSAYIGAQKPEFARALSDLRAILADLLPDHVECISYAMPGFRHPNGKMTIGYAAFARHIGLYPHSGSIISQIDCKPFKTSKSGVTFPPETLPPSTLIAQIIKTRLAQIAR